MFCLFGAHNNCIIKYIKTMRLRKHTQVFNISYHRFVILYECWPFCLVLKILKKPFIAQNIDYRKRFEKNAYRLHTVQSYNMPSGVYNNNICTQSIKHLTLKRLIMILLFRFYIMDDLCEHYVGHIPS